MTNEQYNGQNCTHCKGNDTWHDNDHDITYCKTCGLVLQDNILQTPMMEYRKVNTEIAYFKRLWVEENSSASKK